MKDELILLRNEAGELEKSLGQEHVDVSIDTIQRLYGHLIAVTCLVGKVIDEIPSEGL